MANAPFPRHLGSPGRISLYVINRLLKVSCRGAGCGEPTDLSLPLGEGAQWAHAEAAEVPVTVRAVVFDIGGVLAVTPDLGTPGKWERALGLGDGQLGPLIQKVADAGAIGTISEEEAVRRIGEILGLDSSVRDAFMADLWTEYLGTLNGELAGYFAGLRPRYRTAIISNSFVGAREREQERYGFGDLTDVIIYSHEAGMSKPDPRIYRLAADRLGVQPEEMVFLDDVPQYVDAARQVGLQAVLFTGNQQAIADIEALLRS
jgi:epoxide hydrolase-like predicted phosphatase